MVLNLSIRERKCTNFSRSHSRVIHMSVDDRYSSYRRLSPEEAGQDATIQNFYIDYSSLMAKTINDPKSFESDINGKLCS